MLEWHKTCTEYLLLPQNEKLRCTLVFDGLMDVTEAFSQEVLQVLTYFYLEVKKFHNLLTDRKVASLHSCCDQQFIHF